MYSAMESKNTEATLAGFADGIFRT